MNGFVEALGIDGNGRLYVGGRFTNAAGIAEADYIARWDGVNWSALGSNGSGDGALNGAVSEIYVAGTNVYIGGEFTDVAGIAEADYIARWDGSNWAALGSAGNGDGALNSAVNAIAAQGSNLYIGGNFENAAGIVEADYIARWDGSNWAALSSDGNGDGAVGSFVHTVLATADKVYVGGIFTNVAGINAADYVAVWDGSNWLALGSNGSGDGALNAWVNKLARSGGTLYVGGNFTDAAGQAAADYLAVWDGNNWAALGNDSVFNDRILEVAIDQSSNIYAGGYFNTVVGQSLAKYVAVWRGSSWAALGEGRLPALKNGVEALAVALDDKVYVGGDFTNAAGIAAADYVAQWDPATGQWSAVGSNGSGNGVLNSGVYALAVAPDGKVYVGGNFINAAGIAAADYVARWDPATGQWSAVGSNGSGNSALNSGVYALAVAPDGKVYVGGWFTNAGGNAAADYVAVWDPATQTWGVLGSNGALNSGVYALAVDPDGKVYVGGWFTDASNNPLADYVASCQITNAFRMFVPAINR